MDQASRGLVMLCGLREPAVFTLLSPTAWSTPHHAPYVYARPSCPSLVALRAPPPPRTQFIYALGPIAHMQENSKYFSSKPCPRPAVMPRVTIQMPVRKRKPKNLEPYTAW